MYLDEWQNICAGIFLEYQHSIPSSKDINITKLASNGSVHTDTCNQAKALKACLIQEISNTAVANGMNKEDVSLFAVNCHNHQNIWIKWLKMVVGNQVKQEIQNGMSELGNSSCVSTDFSEILLSIDKTFNDASEYANGHNLEFKDWLIENFPQNFYIN